MAKTAAVNQERRIELLVIKAVVTGSEGPLALNSVHQVPDEIGWDRANELILKGVVRPRFVDPDSADLRGAGSNTAAAPTPKPRR